MIREAIDVPHDALRSARAMREHPAVVSPRALPVIRSGEASHCEIDSLETRLTLLRDRLDEIYDGRLELPAPASRSEQQHALCAFAETIKRHQIPRQHFLDLAEGCRMDLVIRRYTTWDDLENYCNHAGGMMGLITSCVLGLTHSGAFAQAITMGNAMQLTTILRDIKYDWDRGRVYLPQEDLRRFRYSEQNLARSIVNEDLRQLMRFQIDRARKLYRAGAQGLCWLAGDGSRLTASALAVIYCGILDAIERRHYDVFTKRAHLTMPQKFRRLPVAWRLARREANDPLPDVF
jgi:phytoene synthase